MNPRRTLMLGLGAALLAPLAGCMSPPRRALNADGSYCHSNGKPSRRVLTCTDAAVPTDAAAALSFQPQAGALTVYVLRKRWGDVAHPVRVQVDERPAAVTVPQSLVRLVLPPGEHRAVADWQGRRIETRFSGTAGAVLFLDLQAPAWVWEQGCEWKQADADSARARARECRLVADLDWRGVALRPGANAVQTGPAGHAKA